MDGLKILQPSLIPEDEYALERVILGDEGDEPRVIAAVVYFFLNATLDAVKHGKMGIHSKL